MILHVRQLAWLNAVPEGAKNSRHKSLSDADENSSFLKLPKIPDAEYLVAFLYEAGLFGSNGMGAVPLTWAEINHWKECTDTVLTTWELLMIKKMSEAYVGEYNQASAKTRPAPYSEVDEDVASNRANVANKLKNAFQSRIRRKPETN